MLYSIDCPICDGTMEGKILNNNLSLKKNNGKIFEYVIFECSNCKYKETRYIQIKSIKKDSHYDNK